MEQSRRVVVSYWRSKMIDDATSDEDKVIPVYKLEEICELLRSSHANIVKYPNSSSNASSINPLSSNRKYDIEQKYIFLQNDVNWPNGWPQEEYPEPQEKTVCMPLSLSCAYPIDNMPHVGDKLFYFPQGHRSTDMPHKIFEALTGILITKTRLCEALAMIRINIPELHSTIQANAELDSMNSCEVTNK